MKILTFDTSLNKTYITYGENQNIIVEKTINSDDEKYHSAYLIPTLTDILKEKKITLQDIDVIGINEGPGSFTGIRICTVIARTVAQQTGCKVVPVPSLEILSRIKTDGKTLVITDARKNKVYIAAYDNKKIIEEPHCINVDDLAPLIKSDTYNLITDNAISSLLKEKSINSLNYEENPYELGKYLYEIVYEKVQTNNDFHWAKAKPLYIQPPSITMPKKVGA